MDGEMRWNRHRRDSTHADIVKVLREHGCSVRDTSQGGETGGSDLIVGLCGRDFQVEVKTDDADLEPEQIEFYSGWAGAPLVVLNSVEAAIAWVNSVRRGA